MCSESTFGKEEVYRFLRDIANSKPSENTPNEKTLKERVQCLESDKQLMMLAGSPSPKVITLPKPVIPKGYEFTIHDWYKTVQELKDRKNTNENDSKAIEGLTFVPEALLDPNKSQISAFNK